MHVKGLFSVMRDVSHSTHQQMIYFSLYMWYYLCMNWRALVVREMKKKKKNKGERERERGRERKIQ